MIMQSTKALESSEVQDYIHDFRFLVSKNLLDTIDITQIYSGREIAAVRYHIKSKVKKRNIKNQRGIFWECIPNSEIRVIITETAKCKDTLFEKIGSNLKIDWE